ncbi:fibrinogen silencer-binding protein-like [Ostrinia furnacalis]|uniref:fibrinogen silencer-binding protein-like n=1 Tax=Ostrinia furnacalis TaxID=93504 RepID=UPI00103E8C94|nr:fibrinogen silencer-binding protein-like [Ostrinia furnacalis]
MEDNKKKRGLNYTASEKELLLDIIKSYQHIIENKETNAQMIIKKREAWDCICEKYNAVAMSGCRTVTWQQLRHLYENLKQRSKKNIAKANRLQFYEKTREIQKKASLDKKEINRTGGGTYKSTLTEQDQQILAMAGCQIKPLSNPYDDAAFYFG